MTPTPDAVKASALERCIRLVRQGGTDLKGSALAREARAELSALRRGVSVEEARIAFRDAWMSQCPDWLDSTALDAGIKAVLALGETGKGVKL